MSKRAKAIRHVGPREGYDRWADTYDETPNPVVRMDDRHTLRILAPKPAERILDAGCGTGRHFGALLAAGSRPVGVDFAAGMLRVARQRFPQVPLAVADLQRPLPVKDRTADAVLCSLVGEHLGDLRTAFQGMYDVLRPGGRLLFSAYHPEMAAAGIEANFQENGVEFRLGAYRHTVRDYSAMLEAVGFVTIRAHEFSGDEELVAALPKASKYLGFPVLLVLQATKLSNMND